jgi:transcriptional regulator with XRE-family HTH domain
MSKTLSQEITTTEEGRRLLNQESAILEVTELICEHLEEENVSRRELADRLGKTKGYITQLLDGRANMTIRTIADVFTALGAVIHFHTDRDTKRASMDAITWDFMKNVGKDALPGEVEQLASGFSDMPHILTAT